LAYLIELIVFQKQVSVLHNVSSLLLVQGIKQLLQLFWRCVRQIACIGSIKLTMDAQILRFGAGQVLGIELAGCSPHCEASGLDWCPGRQKLMQLCYSCVQSA